MIENPKVLIEEFLEALSRAGLTHAACTVAHEPQSAPHKPHAIPTGKCAIYVFSLCDLYGSRCPAGVNRVLKVGKAGPNSNARFHSQHYNPHSAQSNLAASLLEARVLWPYLGVNALQEDSVKPWVMNNTDRDNFYLEAGCTDLLAELERYLRGRLGPVFEGG